MQSVNAMLGENGYDAVTLGATIIARDLIVKKKLNARKAVTLSAAQYAYLLTIVDPLNQLVAKTGITNTMAIDMLANTVGLAGFLLAFKKLGLSGKKGDVASDGGVIPEVKGGKGMGKEVLNAMLESFELLVERNVLEYALNAVVPSSKPVPATTL